MNRVQHLRRRLRSIRCSLKQNAGKFFLFMWPGKMGEKKKLVAQVPTLNAAEAIFANLTMKD